MGALAGVIAVGGCHGPRIETAPITGEWMAPAQADMRALPAIRLVPYLEIGRGGTGSGQSPQRGVIRDSVTLDHAWSVANAPRPIPSLAYDRAMVLVVYAGAVVNDGRAAIDSVGMVGDTLTAVVALEQGCAPIAFAMNPAVLVLVPRYRGPIRFIERRRQAGSCHGDGQ